MCKYNRSEQNPEQHSAYILCNLIFSGDHREFGVSDVIKWMAEYDIVMTESQVRRELAAYVQQGDLYACIDRYIVRQSAFDANLQVLLAAS